MSEEIKKITVVTHNDRFHADDVFALATLRIKFGNQIDEVIRTRDESIIEKADIVFDVGEINDADKNRFDHHQLEGGGERENGFPYASFGLVWKKWGEEISGSKEAFEIIDKKIVTPIDAADNGFSFYKYEKDSEIFEYTTGSWVASFGATWKEGDNYDEMFFEAASIAEKILKREIIQAKAKVDSIPIIKDAYENSDDKRILILEDYMPWQGIVKDFDDVFFVISPSKDKTKWRVNCVQESGFVNKKDLPKTWAALRNEDLEKETGVKGAIFCHRKLFVCYAKEKDQALQLAKIALNY